MWNLSAQAWRADFTSHLVPRMVLVMTDPTTAFEPEPNRYVSPWWIIINRSRNAIQARY